MRRAEPIAGLGGIVLLVSLFLDNGAGRVVDVILGLLSLLAIAVPVVSLVTRGPAKSIGTAVLASALGWLAVVLMLVQLLDDSGLGVWLGIAGALIAWIGSWMSMRDESTPGAAPPDVPRRPVPNITH
jgi:hypothetical protein